MAQLRRATTQNEVIAKIDTWLGQAHSYLDHDSFEFKSFWRDAEKLANADGFAASIARALISHMAGDMTNATHWLGNARKWPSSAVEVNNAELVIASNLGYFSIAYEAIESQSEMSIDLPVLSNLAMLSGSFTLLAECRDGTRFAEGYFREQPDRELARRCVMALHNTQISEASVRAVLDLAGEVLRAHRILFAGDAPLIRAVDDGLLYQLRVKVAPAEASRLTDEVIMKMIEQDLDAPGLAFSFISA